MKAADSGGQLGQAGVQQAQLDQRRQSGRCRRARRASGLSERVQVGQLAAVRRGLRAAPRSRLSCTYSTSNRVRSPTDFGSAASRLWPASSTRRFCEPTDRRRQPLQRQLVHVQLPQSAQLANPLRQLGQGVSRPATASAATAAARPPRARDSKSVRPQAEVLQRAQPLEPIAAASPAGCGSGRASAAPRGRRPTRALRSDRRPRGRAPRSSRRAFDRRPARGAVGAVPPGWSLGLRLRRGRAARPPAAPASSP